MAFHVYDVPLPAKASTNYIAGTVVGIDSIAANNLPVPVVGAPAGLVPLGVIVENTDYTLGQTPVVRQIGMIDCIAAGAIDPSTQPLLTWDASGHVTPVGSTSSTLYPVIGIAQEKCTTAGDLVRVLVAPQTYTTHA